MWYEKECKSEPLNGGEGQQGRMSTSRVKPSLLDAKQSTNSTLHRFIYFHKGCSAGIQPVLDGGTVGGYVPDCEGFAYVRAYAGMLYI